jgi:hypothetical protein
MMSRWTFLAAAWLCVVGAASARPAHKQAAAQYFGSFLPKKLNDCLLCHLPDPSNKAALDEADKPHNDFGARLKAARSELRKSGKAITIEARLDAVLNEDTDGDGVSNLLEILAGRGPGDNADRPSDAELAQAKPRLVEFAKARMGYAWRPFEIVKQPSAPQIKSSGWVRNPIDAFIAAEHETLGVTPRPEAPPAVLLRRLYLDLIGLPPTRQELREFLEECGEARVPSTQYSVPRRGAALAKGSGLSDAAAANSVPSTRYSVPDAVWSKWVNRLLDDPRHGERWGRHWMDIWRYSDWAGYGPQVRDSQPHIWRWRDWIIEALNTDKGYDRMVLEMLAGDELAPEDPKALVGTGYLVRNWKLLSREKWIQDTVEHTTMAFLGLTVQCAKCHDHMFDPIAQREYYQIRAIFEPHLVRTDRLPGQLDVAKDGLPRVYDGKAETPTYLFIRGDDRTPDKSKALQPAALEALGGKFEVRPVKLPVAAYAPDKRPFVIEDSLREAARLVEQKREGFMRRGLAFAPGRPAWSYAAPLLDPKAQAESLLAEVEWATAAAKQTALHKVLAVEQLEDAGVKEGPKWEDAARATVAAQREAARLDAKQKWLAAKKSAAAAQGAAAKAKKGDKNVAALKEAYSKAEAKCKEPVTSQYEKRVVATYPQESTGRRLALARWIAHRDNPLTARVAVNHIWARHFGTGIVPSTFDFGKNGRPPSHPALLDWLAAEFMERGWSMKAIHRLIVTSATYRQASTPDARNAGIDRDNKYLWRYPLRRLEAEAVRDSVFYVAGKLDPALGGPEFDYPLGLTVPRRSLYFRHAAEKQMEFLTIFDAASVNECYERKHAIVPQQALALINSELTLKNARILARSLAGTTSGDASAFVTAAFEQVLSRAPTAAELSECVTFLSEQSRRLEQAKLAGQAGLTPDGSLPAPDPALRARENLVHVLLNHHEFVTIR